MPIGEDSGPIHPETTRRSGYHYFFYAKHHGQGGPDAAQWLPTLSHDEEFSVFNEADFHGISDEQGRLYGIRPGDDLRPLELGTRSERIAVFPVPLSNVPWHGYPVYPVDIDGPDNRRGEKLRPSKDVFLKMEKAGLLSTRNRKRLWKGKR